MKRARECGEVCKAVAVEGVRHHRPQRTVDRLTANRYRHSGIFRLLVERAVLIEKGLRVGQVACRKLYHARLQFPQWDGNGDAASIDGGHRYLWYSSPRAARKAPGGQEYHVLNRSVGKMHLFGKDADFEAFQRVMIEAYQRQPIRILS